MTNQNWMNDETLRHIDPTKLMFLQKLVFETSGLGQKEMMPFLMALASKAKANNITFTDEEVNTIIETLKKYSTSDELKKMDQVLQMTKFMNK